MSGFNFTEFVRLERNLRKVETNLPKVIERVLKETGKVFVITAKAKIGTYQNDYSTPQGAWFPEWETLAGSTLADKIYYGYAPPDNPLLRDGTMRDSIGVSFTGHYHIFEVTLGSTDPKSLWQEFGTVKIPPRSFIGATVAEQTQKFALPRLTAELQVLFRGLR